MEHTFIQIGDQGHAEAGRIETSRFEATVAPLKQPYFESLQDLVAWLQDHDGRFEYTTAFQCTTNDVLADLTKRCKTLEERPAPLALAPVPFNATYLDTAIASLESAISKESEARRKGEVELLKRVLQVAQYSKADLEGHSHPAPTPPLPPSRRPLWSAIIALALTNIGTIGYLLLK